jgi:putative membrane protein
MAGALVAYLHYVAMASIATLLVVELMLCVPGLAGNRIRLLARLDLLYMSAAMLALASGIARVIWFGRGIGFYMHNPVFYIKLALFVAVALLSIPPTVQFLRWLRNLDTGTGAAVAEYQVLRIRRYILAELLLFAFIPLMATFMARGIGIQAAAP